MRLLTDFELTTTPSSRAFLIITILVLLSDNTNSSSSFSSSSLPCTDDSYVCQHKALNDEILAAGNDPVKLEEIERRITKLRERERERERSQQEQDERRRFAEFEQRAQDIARNSRTLEDVDDGSIYSDERSWTWFTTVIWIGGVLVCGCCGLGCLISIISAARHTGSLATRSFDIDEPIVIGDSLLAQPAPGPGRELFTRHGHGHASAPPLLVVVVDDRTDDDFRASSASERSEPPPDYEEAMRTSRQPQYYNPSG